MVTVQLEEYPMRDVKIRKFILHLYDDYKYAGSLNGIMSFYHIWNNVKKKTYNNRRNKRIDLEWYYRNQSHSNFVHLSCLWAITLPGLWKKREKKRNIEYLEIYAFRHDYFATLGPEEKQKTAIVNELLESWVAMSCS